MAAAKKVSHSEKEAEIQELDAAARDVAKDACPNHNEVYTTDAVLPTCQRPGCGKPVPEKKREAIATATAFIYYEPTSASFPLRLALDVCCLLSIFIAILLVVITDHLASICGGIPREPCHCLDDDSTSTSRTKFTCATLKATDEASTPSHDLENPEAERLRRQLINRDVELTRSQTLARPRQQ